MIYTSSRPGHGVRIGPYKGEPAEMPWLTYWQGLAQAGSQRERWTAGRVASLSIWQRLNWEPAAAERVLAWISTGSWAQGVTRLVDERGRPL